MATLVHDHPIAWTPPAPLWIGAGHGEMQAPAILRFTTDDFMDEFQRLLATDPGRLAQHIAVPETWRGIQMPARTRNLAGGRAGLLSRIAIAARRPTALPTTRPAPLSTAVRSDGSLMPLKLYQPAQQRFYLVGTSLICQRPGLPDRKVDAAKQEKASFVIRRYFPPPGNPARENLPAFNAATWTEHAYVAHPSGGFTWVPVAPAGSADAVRRIVLTGEERLPLFPLTFAEDDQRTRRLLGGLIPVARREAYHTAERLTGAVAAGDAAARSRTARLALLRKLVSEPWKALIELARRAGAAATGSKPTDVSQGNFDTSNATIRREARAAIQLGSWLVLADLASYLKTYLPTVYEAVRAGTSTLSGASGEVLRVLRQTVIGATLKTKVNATPVVTDRVATSLADALQRFISDATVLSRLEAAGTPYVRPTDAATDAVTANPEYPAFLFPLGDPDHPEEAARPDFTAVPASSTETPPDESEPVVGTPGASQFDASRAAVDKLAAVIIRALEPVANAPEPSVPTAADRPADLRAGWFVIRCVYERPECGTLHDDVVSAPTERFQMAHFFDPDAPARPIRIGLPIDTTPAGLRKFDKNTAFVMSDVLCGQVARLKGLTLGDLVLSVLPWPFHKDISVPDGGPCKSGGLNIGMVCSLSIPIITLCALVLLMIMVTLLDLIFHWIPFFIVCFPLPGLRAKQETA